MPTAPLNALARCAYPRPSLEVPPARPACAEGERPGRRAGSCPCAAPADHQASKEGPLSPQLRCGCGALLPTDVRCPCREEHLKREGDTERCCSSESRASAPPPGLLRDTLHLGAALPGIVGGGGSEAFRGKGCRSRNQPRKGA